MDQHTSNILIILSIAALYATMFDARLGIVVSILSLFGFAVFMRRRKTTH